MAGDVHDYKRRIERSVEIVRNSNLSPVNKKLILDFKDESFVQGLSLGRIARYMFDARKICEWLGKDFSQASPEDIKAVVAHIGSSDYANPTKRDLKITLKKLYRFAKGAKDYPEEVAWIRPSNGNGRRKLPEDLLSPENVGKMISSTESAKERAIVSTLFESGCRVGEILGMKIKHIKPANPGVQIMVDGKTGPRRIRLVSSEPYLKEWLNKHPEKGNPESFVWLGKGNRERIHYSALSILLKRLGRRAGINKKIFPHLFRHSRATYLANFLTEAQMKEYFGWVQASDMAGVYVHLSGRDVDNAILKIHGIDTNGGTKPEQAQKPINCKRCNELNTPTNSFCNRCGLPLNEDAVKDLMKKDLDIPREKLDLLASAIPPELMEKLAELVADKLTARERQSL